MSNDTISVSLFSDFKVKVFKESLLENLSSLKRAMWLLKKLNDGTTKYLISDIKSYTIGRKNCDVVLEQDPSISRKHCTIYVAKQSECPFTVNSLTGVWMVDEQSKYGTYLKSNNDWIKINSCENKNLNNGSVIKFGLMENIWSVEYKPLIACVSGISTEQKKKIESTLQQIDGILKNTWSNQCSLIIVNEVTLTVKVVLALIHGVPIVTPNYLQKIVQCIKNQEVLPDHKDFRPEIKEVLLEKSLVSLDVNKNRKELFKGMKFVIPTKKQLETLKEVIISAGGSIELLTCNSDWKKFAEDDVIMIQLPFNSRGIPEELKKSVKEITSFLKTSYGRRVIPESEIAQAVAYASTEKFCNPTNTWFNIQIGKKNDISLGSVIVDETPMATEDVRPSSVGVVPCSATIYSEPLSQSAIELQPPMYNNMESQIDVSQKLLTERKRTHSTNQEDYEMHKKKARTERTYNDKLNASLLENEVLQSTSKKGEVKTSNKKKNQTIACITNYFQKQSKSVEETVPKVMKQSSSDFWNCDTINNYPLKRKVSFETNDSGDNGSKKKAKLPEVKTSKLTTPEFGIETPREIIEVIGNNKCNEKQAAIQKNRHIEKENDLNGFFEKEKTDVMDDLNTTIFSLKLISPDYLKEDGSLIEPPSEPINVKRFKKQKLFSITMPSLSEEIHDKLSEEGWIEPHSHFHSIFVSN